MGFSLVVEIILTSTGISFVPPIFLIIFSCKTLKSLACNSVGSEFISSSSRVPPLACSNKPILFSAPVKPPFSVPNKIASKRLSGRVAQFIAKKALSFLELL